jgi:dihydroorotate dehydrogenase (NAD+) catalytic subunit
MNKNKIPDWFPSHPPIYDIHKTYAENASYGPFFSGSIPERIFPPEERWIDFLGYKIASPIGIPAGPLLTSNWIKLAGELGFDVVTYKTIRSEEYPAHPLPNMVFVDTEGMLSEKPEKKTALCIPQPKTDIKDLAVTNSFGMPSKSPSFLMEDIPRANASLKKGQIMIVSVVGTPRPGENFLEDFVKAARLAKDAGAKIIEANFSCPNVAKKEGCLYMTPDAVLEIGSALAAAIHPIPLIIKMGVFSSLEQMRAVMIAAAQAGIRSICGINTISMAVMDPKGHPALGPNRTTAGICGGPIREAALSFIRHATKINRQEKLDLTIMGVGGITVPEHFDLFLEAGAQIAMTATGMMWDPYLALRYHTLHKG